MTAVEQLDRHRSAWVRVLEELARDIPEFVWLGKFNEIQAETDKAGKTTKGRRGNNKAQEEPVPQKSPILASVKQVEIEGYAFTLNSLAALMINMMRSDYFDNVELISSTEQEFQEEQKAFNFVLSANLHYLSDEEQNKMIGQAKDGKKSSSRHKVLN